MFRLIKMIPRICYNIDNNNRKADADKHPLSAEIMKTKQNHRIISISYPSEVSFGKHNNFWFPN